MKRYMAIDVGGSSIKYGVVSEAGEIEGSNKRELPSHIEEFYEVIEGIKKELGNIEGAAFSFPGAVDEKKGIIGGASAVPYIHNFNIKEELEKRLDLNISMENDANCAALAEVWIGAAKENNDSLFLIIGSGIGGAIVKERQIHKGSNLHGGEFGFSVVSMGNTIKTWSDVASTRAIIDIYKEKTTDTENGRVDGEIIFKRSEEGDRKASEAIEKFYKNLSIGIFNLQYIYDPEVIVIGGGISGRKDLVENIEKYIDEIMSRLDIAKIRPKIKICEYQNNANLIGAVYNFLTKENNK